MSEAPRIDKGANPMPNLGKWITHQIAFLFFADGENLLLQGPRDFPLFTGFFLHRAPVSAYPPASLKEESMLRGRKNSPALAGQNEALVSS